MNFFLKPRILLKDNQFWIKILSIWGVTWSCAEGSLYLIQQTGWSEKEELGYFVLALFLLSITIAAILHWPLKEQKVRLNKQGVTISLVYGDFWAQEGGKIVGVTRCFSANVDDSEIHSNTLHGQFIKLNFPSNSDAKLRIDAELVNDPGPYQPGKTIKISGNLDTAYLVGLTKLDTNNVAKMTLDEYFTALSSMWQFIEERNGGERLVCPLIGSGRSRLNYSAAALFRELLSSALSAINSRYITNNLVFVVYPMDVENGQVDLHEFNKIFSTLCDLENMQKVGPDYSSQNSIEI